MSTIKRYQLLKVLSLATHFKVDDNTVTVRFMNGIRTPELIRGRFTTDDPNLQKAIEESKGFNVDYFLENEVMPEIEEVKADVPMTKVIKEPAEKPAKKEKEKEVVEATAGTDYPEILTVRDAREKLIELYPDELKPKDLPNKIAVLARSKEKNITFSKLV